MYAKIQNNQIVEWPIFNIREKLPNISLPETISDQVLPEEYVIVHSAPQPEYSRLTHRLVSAEPVYVDGRWTQSYDIIPLAAHELELNQQALISAAESLTQEYLDKFVQTRGYSNIVSAISYQNSTNVKYAQEAQYALAARDSVWLKFYELLDDSTQAVLELEPQQFIKLLPVLIWPV